MLLKKPKQKAVTMLFTESLLNCLQKLKDSLPLEISKKTECITTILLPLRNLCLQIPDSRTRGVSYSLGFTGFCIATALLAGRTQQSKQSEFILGVFPILCEFWNALSPVKILSKRVKLSQSTICRFWKMIPESLLSQILYFTKHPFPVELRQNIQNEFKASSGHKKSSKILEKLQKRSSDDIAASLDLSQTKIHASMATLESKFQIFAMDGKNRPTVGQESETDCRIYDVLNKYVLAKGTTEKKKGEQTVLKEMLSQIKFPFYPGKQNLVTGDAGLLGPEMTHILQKKNLGYVLQIKGNAGDCYYEATQEKYWKNASQEPEIYMEKKNGRLVTREIQRLELHQYPVDVQNMFQKYGRPSCIIRVFRHSEELKTGKETEEYSYYLLNNRVSKNLTLMEAGLLVQGHWSVEVFHYHKDVNFNEDKTQARTVETTRKQSMLEDYVLSLALAYPKGVSWVQGCFSTCIHYLKGFLTL